MLPVKVVSSSRLLPDRLPGIHDALESFLRDIVVAHMLEYEGLAQAPNEEFGIQWVPIGFDIEECMASGLIPEDSIKSMGLQNDSYVHMKLCADQLQGSLFENKIEVCLGNLRGFRRLFSESPDPVLRHAFRGPPGEVLQNIYFGGYGILPEDRMMVDDPFHYRREEAFPLCEH